MTRLKISDLLGKQYYRTPHITDRNFDVELHPAFDTLFRLAKESEHQNSTIELSESIDFTNKKDPKKGQFVNGGTAK